MRQPTIPRTHVHTSVSNSSNPQDEAVAVMARSEKEALRAAEEASVGAAAAAAAHRTKPLTDKLPQSSAHASTATPPLPRPPLASSSSAGPSTAGGGGVARTSGGSNSSGGMVGGLGAARSSAGHQSVSIANPSPLSRATSVADVVGGLVGGVGDVERHSGNGAKRSSRLSSTGGPAAAAATSGAGVGHSSATTGGGGGPTIEGLATAVSAEELHQAALDRSSDLGSQAAAASSGDWAGGLPGSTTQQGQRVMDGKGAGGGAVGHGGGDARVQGGLTDASDASLIAHAFAATPGLSAASQLLCRAESAS